MTKSSETERRQQLVPDLFKRTEELKLLHEVLTFHSGDAAKMKRLSGRLTLGDLEDLAVSALENMKLTIAEQRINKIVRQRQDWTILANFKMQNSRVNIKNIKKKEKYKSVCDKVLEKYDQLKENNVYLWTEKRKADLIISGLGSAKSRFIRARSPSSSSDDSPVRNRKPSASPEPRRSVSRQVSGSDSDTETRKREERSQKKPEIKRAKVGKKVSDPNKFKIPKMEKASENKQSMKSILEEGLRKGSAHPQNRQANRYHDWRKEQRIKQIRKEKVIDIKKVI